MSDSDELVFVLGGELPVHRLGFGAARLVDSGYWGPPEDPVNALQVARRAVELGVTFIDTADSYGLGLNEEQLAEALHPYRAGLVIGTKSGMTHPSPGEWIDLGRPEYLRQQCHLSLRRLRLECIDLFQLHRIDELVPAAEQFGALKQLQDEGKIRHIGLSEVTVAQLEEARRQIDVASVQNLYNVTDRHFEDVLEYCEREGIAFITWRPLSRGAHATAGGALAEIAKQLDASPVQVSLAWLLRRSPVIVPIPGTSSLRHLAENVAAAQVVLSDEQFQRLSGIA